MFVEWLVFLVIGLSCAAWSSMTMLAIVGVFALQGVVYNVPPLRTKDKPYLDVISESINNPLRLMIGWAIVDATTVPPASVILSYWLGGAFLMAAKRLSEYREIVTLHGKDLLMRYRASFAGYTDTSLNVSCFVYAMLSSFFLAVFFEIPRRIHSADAAHHCPVRPLSRIVDESRSSAQKPEKLFRERGLMVLVVLLAGAFVVTTFVDIPALEWITRATLHHVTVTPPPHLLPADWRGIELVAFDVDGTLYNQRALRLRMAKELLWHAVRRRDLAILEVIRAYRRTREQLSDEELGDFEPELVRRTAAATGRDDATVRAIALEWLEQRPLVHLASCRYDGLVELFGALKRSGKIVGALSDYPARDKLAAMGLAVDLVVSATDADVGRLKPHPLGLQQLMRRAGVAPAATLLIGDRVERDGHAAARAGTRCLIRSGRPRSPWQVIERFNDPLFAPLLGLIPMRDVVAKFARYLLTGGAAAVVDVGGFALLHVAGVAPLPAAAASFAVAAVVNYLLTSRFVFHHRGLGWRFPLFLLGALVGLFVNVGVTRWGHSLVCACASRREGHWHRDGIHVQLPVESTRCVSAKFP